MVIDSVTVDLILRLQYVIHEDYILESSGQIEGFCCKASIATPTRRLT